MSSPAALPMTPTRVYLLTALDRCDACGARAYYRARLATGGSHLLFCYHHGVKHYAALALKVSEWLDETDQLFSGVKR